MHDWKLVLGVTKTPTPTLPLPSKIPTPSLENPVQVARVGNDLALNLVVCF